MATHGSCRNNQCACLQFEMAAASESTIATCLRCNHPRESHTTVASTDRSTADSEQSNASGGLLYRVYNSIYSYFWPTHSAPTPPTNPPRCSLPGCARPRFRDPATGRLHEYCGKGHAMEHRKPIGATGLQCNTPGCPNQRCTNPNGGHYNYCSISCRDSGGPVPEHLRCMTPNCSKPRCPNPGRGGYYDYCSKRCMQDNDQTFRFVILEAASPEYITICEKFRNDWSKGHCPNIDYVLKVCCDQSMKRWMNYKATLASKGSPITVEQYYHGTIIKCNPVVTKKVCSHSDCGVCGISHKGFNKKLIGKNIPKFKRFGDGFYLAPHSSKCHDYTQGTHRHRAMLLCDVLPGKKYTFTKNQIHLTAPPDGFDSVYGKPGHNLNYPEVVLFDEASILPSYIIMYKRDGIEKIAK